MSVDDRAIEMKKQPELAAMRDVSEEDPIEHEATGYGLNYVTMDGNIGCMVNGAGLAMATMDIIKFAGGEPANFLDLGGGANKEGVSRAFRLILSDPKVKGILVNIFGGIVLCDMVAEGIVAAAREIGVEVPMVVRLDGTNSDEAKQILAESGLGITPADGMQDGAEKIVAAVAAA